MHIDAFVKRCKVCAGTGKVSLTRQCICGRAANIEKDGKAICGTPTCDTATKTDHEILEDFQNSMAWMGI